MDNVADLGNKGNILLHSQVGWNPYIDNLTQSGSLINHPTSEPHICITMQAPGTQSVGYTVQAHIVKKRNVSVFSGLTLLPVDTWWVYSNTKNTYTTQREIRTMCQNACPGAYSFRIAAC